MNTASIHGAAPLETVLLRSFLAIVDSGSFALAAEHLALTPSAISGHLKRLEQTTGVSLLQRTTRRLELTPAGQTLSSYAREILQLEREARAKLQGKALTGQLRIGASEDFAQAWLPQVLHGFGQRHPEATLELKVGITAALLRQQEAGELDLVFGKQCRRVDGVGTLLWEEPLVWVYAEHQPLPAGSALPLALFAQPCVYRESAISALRSIARDWRMVFESSSMAACVSAARAGLAVTVVAHSQCQDGLRVLDKTDGLPALPLARFYAFAGRDNALATALVEAAQLAGLRRFSAHT